MIAFMGRTLVLVGIGGLIGSICRYLIAVYFTKNFPIAFPYGTFVVNIVGCFLIGIFYGLSERYQWFSPELRLFLTTGFCGGFTTFSSFAFENVKLLQSSEYFTVVLYISASLILGITAVFGGAALAKL